MSSSLRETPVSYKILKTPLQQHFRDVQLNNCFGKCLLRTSFGSKFVGCVPATLIREMRHNRFSGCFPKLLEIFILEGSSGSSIVLLVF